MIDKDVIYKERMYAENQLKEKSGSNIVVEWMSEIKELAKNGYVISSANAANARMKDEKFQRIIGICDAVIMVLKEN